MVGGKPDSANVRPRQPREGRVGQFVNRQILPFQVVQKNSRLLTSYEIEISKSVHTSSNPQSYSYLYSKIFSIRVSLLKINSRIRIRIRIETRDKGPPKLEAQGRIARRWFRSSCFICHSPSPHKSSDHPETDEKLGRRSVAAARAILAVLVFQKTLIVSHGREP